VEIFLNFIGNFEVPGYEEAIPEAFDPVEHQREIWRNHYHRHKEEIRIERAKRAEEKKAAKLEAKLAARASRSREEIEAEVKAKWERKRKYQREYQREWNRRRKQAASEGART
jgi:Skp family chaperone for outer membrane proteins